MDSESEDSNQFSAENLPNQPINEELINAVYQGDEQRVKILLDRGADINIQGGVYGNALKAAASQGNEQLVKILLDRGADINIQGGVYGNALQAAASQENEQIVKILLDHGADINIQGGVYGNALQAAASQGDEQIMKILLDRGADINIQGGEYGNALQAAASRGNEQLVKILLDRGADINIQGGLYGNALQAAASRGNEQLVKILLDHDADINIQGGVYGNALQAAAYRENEQLVKILLDRGADINIQGGRYGNALQAAASQGNEQLVKILLDRGADINIQGGVYGNALQAAASQGNEQIVKILLDHGADITIQPLLANRVSLLHASIISGTLALLKILFSKGADIYLTSQDESGQTPLHLAVEKGDIGITKFLLEQGASPDTPDLSDTTAFQSAMRRENPELVLLLYSKVKAKLPSISASDWRRCLSGDHPSDIEIIGGDVPGIHFGDGILQRRLDEMSYPLPRETSKVPAREHFMEDHKNMKRIFILKYCSLLRSPNPFYCRWWMREAWWMRKPGAAPWRWVVRMSSAPSNNTVRQTPAKTCFLQCGLSLNCLVLPKHTEDWTGSLQLSESFLTSLERCQGIMWIMVRPDAKDISSHTSSSLLQSQVFFSTSEYAQIPPYATDLFVPLVQQVQVISNNNFAIIQRRFFNLRSRVLRSSGNDTNLIGHLLTEVQLLEALHENLKKQVERLYAFRRQYLSESWRVLYEQPSDQIQEEMRKFENEIEVLNKDGEEKNKYLTNLSQNIIQLEFNLTSISEAQKSTSTNRSLKRLTWVTFIFLPLLFIASLFGMNIDLLANNPAWWWYPVLASGITILTFAVWGIFKRSNTLEGSLEDRFAWLFRKRREGPDLEEASTPEPRSSRFKTAAFPAFGKKRS
ncbi:hypothetical protein GJ744_011874 [Endocarpon pusillum]|uniref:Uncharacterized protein n=1 Tax=Endocarpon pusillum TaxID=364733 RepID=A0A8H7AFT5_9EURO|nr:hypothetical protein GJ744_011874 [Endocarpon pusillum]